MPPKDAINKGCEVRDRLSELPKMVRREELAYLFKGALAGLINSGL